MPNVLRATLAGLLVGATCLAVPPVVAQENDPSRRLTLVPAPIGDNGEFRNLYTGSYALLVGVEEYDDPGWARLPSIRGELTDLREALRTAGFQDVQLLMNPTRAMLDRAMGEFIARYGAEEKNRLLFFFAGHGHTVGDAGERTGYVIPRDAPRPFVDGPAGGRVSGRFLSTALSMDHVVAWAHNITARHVMFAFDSCFSGTVFGSRSNEPVRTPITARTAGKVRMFLTAGDPYQTVPSVSQFTPLFSDGLRGEADINQDGYVTGTELGNWIQHEALQRGVTPSPQFGKLRERNSDVGEMVFAVRDRPAPATPSAAAATATATATVVLPPPAPAVSPAPRRIRVWVGVDRTAPQYTSARVDAQQREDSVQDIRKAIADKRQDWLELTTRPEDADVRVHVVDRASRESSRGATLTTGDSLPVSDYLLRAELVTADYREPLDVTVSGTPLGPLWRAAAGRVAEHVESFARNNRDRLVALRDASPATAREGDTARVPGVPIGNAAPAASWRVYEPVPFMRVSVPADWLETPANGYVNYAPPRGLLAGPGGTGASALVLGVQVGSAPRRAASLHQDSTLLLQTFAANNPGMRQQTAFTREVVAGREALTARLTNPGEADEESITLTTVGLANGQLLYVIAVSPSAEWTRHAETFSRVLQSIQLTTP